MRASPLAPPPISCRARNQPRTDGPPVALRISPVYQPLAPMTVLAPIHSSPNHRAEPVAAPKTFWEFLAPSPVRDRE
jgi:hypothetical protein